MIESGSSSESEAGADLLESILGFGGAQSPSQRNGRVKRSSKKPTETFSSDQNKAAGAVIDRGAYNGLELELKGLPLRVDPQRCSDKDSDRLILQPHQKVLRLLVDGDPDANPADLLSAYIASLGDNLKPTDVLSDKKIQVKGAWYSVTREASRGEVLLGPRPADAQLLTPERHLGLIRFSRCDPPEEHCFQLDSFEEDKSWETGPSFARFHKLQHYGSDTKFNKPKKGKAGK